MRPGRCAGCKYLRRKCPPDCFLSPYFPSNDPQRFACVHRIYGASNIIKMLQKLKSHELRARAADSLHAEAQHRIEDPVYGCVGIITQLNQQIHDAETELAKTRAQITLISSSTATNFGVHETHHRHHLDHNYDRRDYYHDHHDYQVLAMESDLNNLLQGQSGIDQQSQIIGPTTKAP